MNIIVQTSAMDATTATLIAGGKRYACLLGKRGVAADKREGDNRTPIGIYPLRRVLYRDDRVASPETGLPVEKITQDMGWCNDPTHPDYNRPVTLPFAASHEDMAREDDLYDIVAVIGHNDDPPQAGRGSAIFMHIAAAPTAGCVGLAQQDLIDVLKLCDASSTITILPPP